eukprot:TRINITY_DN282_c0_g1_i1.p1 TRINITY_DN282_c0_g1~~TRINITY_DN282_c0_g1_i1.p1  ORF type:complete len:141 (+),score=49.00 TRINITY_DN282_c0_g1_i1:150-572(+)
MKYNKKVTSSRRKNRKAHFQAPSHIRRKIMSTHLSKELRSKYGVRRVPIRKDDEVKVVRGSHKDTDGKIISVIRKKFIVKIDKVTVEKKNGQTQNVGIHPSNLVITALKINNQRLKLLERRKREVKNKEKKTDSKPETKQ